jgi:predicted esterase
VSILSGITSPVKLGGIFGLSCYLLLHSKVQSLVPPENANLETPIFMGHGDRDPLVLPKWGQMSAELLKQWGYRVNLKFYPYVLLPIEVKWKSL